MARGLCFDDGGCFTAESQRDARDESAEQPMADDQLGQGVGHGVVCGGCERDKNSLLVGDAIELYRTGGRQHDALCSAAEQALHILVAIGAGHED